MFTMFDGGGRPRQGAERGRRELKTAWAGMKNAVGCGAMIGHLAALPRFVAVVPEGRSLARPGCVHHFLHYCASICPLCLSNKQRSCCEYNTVYLASPELLLHRHIIPPRDLSFPRFPVANRSSARCRIHPPRTYINACRTALAVKLKLVLHCSPPSFSKTPQKISHAVFNSKNEGSYSRRRFWDEVTASGMQYISAARNGLRTENTRVSSIDLALDAHSSQTARRVCQPAHDRAPDRGTRSCWCH
jgi:hypothetical protein